jgi:hypothetical protein
VKAKTINLDFGPDHRLQSALYGPADEGISPKKADEAEHEKENDENMHSFVSDDFVSHYSSPTFTAF